ncbi:MAG: response regulator transcription factor [Treponema sp.]|nr:response regulator transcription factor [Treponema sp.]
MRDSPDAAKTAVLLIEDHPLMRRGLAACLEDTGRFSVTGSVGSLKEGRRFIEGAGKGVFPKLVILDIHLGAENGLEFIEFFRGFCKTRGIAMPAVLVCSVLEDPFRVRTALRMGAAGYIHKSTGEIELLRSIETVLSGGEYIDPRLQVKLGRDSGGYSKFTRREEQILTMIKQNYTNQRIAAELFISLRTVENHISHIYLKTSRYTRQELVDY